MTSVIAVAMLIVAIYQYAHGQSIYAPCAIALAAGIVRLLLNINRKV